MADLELGDYRALVEALKYCVLLHDARTYDIIWANRAACDLLEWTVDELKPLKAPDMSKNARQYSRELGHRWLRGAVEHGLAATEWCYRTKSGEEILTEAIAIRVDLPSRPIVMVQFRDIAEEKAVRRDLFRTEGRLRAFLGNLAEGIVVLDDEGRVDFASESAATLLGVPVTRLEGADFADYCSDAPTRAVLAEAIATTTEGVPAQEGRYSLAAPGNAPRWYAGTCQYIEIESDLRGHLLLFHDITDRVRSEEEHRRDTQHLDHLARYNAMGDMAMAIAHEVSQPLAAAYNFVEGVRGRLESGDDRESVAWGLDNARRQIDRAGQILRSLRQYVGRLEQSEQLADLNTIVADCAYFIELRASEHGVGVSVELAGEPLPIRCENVLIGQVVMNLAFNAIDEMARWPRPQRRVELATRRSADGCAELSVRDFGQGLREVPGDRIFDGVFTSKENGSGIGLALSHRIVTRHHGSIWAAENEPHGAVFRFALPIAE